MPLVFCDNPYTMRELHGVIDLPEGGLSSLKRQFLLFDRLHLTDRAPPEDTQLRTSEETDLDFLRSRGVVLEFETDKWLEARLHSTIASNNDFVRSLQPSSITGDDPISALTDFVIKARERLTPDRRSDYMVRYLSTTLRDDLKIDAVHICKAPLPPRLTNFDASTQHVLSIAVEAFPVPDETCAWQDILDFKAELRDKQWDFRHFIKDLATKPRTEAEILDEINYGINKYRRQMELRRLKASRTAFEAYVIPAIEFFEDFAKFNWAKLAKLGISGKQRKIELMEAELKAPGMECAYVFEALDRFGKS